LANRPTPLALLPNLGPASSRWLSSVGVRTRRDLEKLGPVAAYALLRQHGYNASLNLVYAIEGALTGRKWNRLPAARKQELAMAARDALVPRCQWCGTDPLYVRYHDEEWGVPVHDDRKHFEFLILEGAQAGLSWITILRKRETANAPSLARGPRLDPIGEGYRESFANFDPVKVARFDARKVKSLLGNPGIVRNRLKIESAISNARAFLAVQKEFGSFDKYIWRFVGGRPIVNRWEYMKQLPARTVQSDALSADLKQRGFRFVGSTIMYAHMQAVGLVNDHTVNCFRYRALTRRRA
jgi:DNA-3-methyladenine glycosylase I